MTVNYTLGQDIICAWDTMTFKVSFSAFRHYFAVNSRYSCFNKQHRRCFAYDNVGNRIAAQIFILIDKSLPTLSPKAAGSIH